MYLFLERGREGEREGEKHQCVVASRVPPIGDLALIPVMCGIEPATLWFPGGHSIQSHTNQGRKCLFVCVCTQQFVLCI